MVQQHHALARGTAEHEEADQVHGGLEVEARLEGEVRHARRQLRRVRVRARASTPIMMTMTASAETVIAVPRDMAKTESTPPRRSPFNSENDSTRSEPEHGRKPTAITADQASRTEKSLPEIIAGSGAWEWPQVAQTSPG